MNLIVKIVEFVKRNSNFIIVTIIMTFCFMFIIGAVKYGHSWGDDFSLYIAQAKAICLGNLTNLYEQNKYAMQHSMRIIGPYLYPNGFPLLLSPIFKFLGLNFIAMKFFCSLFLIFSIPLLYFVFLPFVSRRIYLYSLIIIFAFNSEIIAFCDTIQSDLPFLFFTLLSFLLMQKKVNLINQILLGFCIFYSYLTRDIGICLIPALIVKRICDVKIRESSQKDILMYLSPILIFGLLILLNTIYMPKGGGNLFELFFHKINYIQIKFFIVYYGELITVFLFKKRQLLLLLPIIPFIMLGIIKDWKRHIHFVVYLLSYFLILFIWPFTQGLRFIIPVLPFIVFFLLKGVYYFLDVLKLPFEKSILLISFFLGFYFSMNYTEINYFRFYYTNESYNPEMQSVYKFIGENVKKDVVIGFFKPRALRLYTGNNSIFVDIEHFPNSDATYMLVNKEVDSDSINRFSKIYETKNYILVKK